MWLRCILPRPFLTRMRIGRLCKMLDYVTYKYVRLRDSRLGALYYILALLILVYSLVEIFLRKGYMQVVQVGAGLAIRIWDTVPYTYM